MARGRYRLAMREIEPVEFHAISDAIEHHRRHAQNRAFVLTDRRTAIVVLDRPYDPVALCAATIAIGWALAATKNPPAG